MQNLGLQQIRDRLGLQQILINHSGESFDWSKLFSGKNVDEQVELYKIFFTILFQAKSLYAMMTLLG